MVVVTGVPYDHCTLREERHRSHRHCGPICDRHKLEDDSHTAGRQAQQHVTTESEFRFSSSGTNSLSLCVHPHATPHAFTQAQRRSHTRARSYHFGGTHTKMSTTGALVLVRWYLSLNSSSRLLRARPDLRTSSRMNGGRSICNWEGRRRQCRRRSVRSFGAVHKHPCCYRICMCEWVDGRRETKTTNENRYTFGCVCVFVCGYVGGCVCAQSRHVY